MNNGCNLISMKMFSISHGKINLVCIKHVKGIDYMNDMVYKITATLKE